MNDQHILITDMNVYSECVKEEILYGYGAYARIARKKGVSRETISRKCRRHEDYVEYREIYDAIPFKLARQIVNHLTKTYDYKQKKKVRKKTEEYRKTSLYKVFKMTDEQLGKIPMMGPKRIKQFKEARDAYYSN